MINRIGPVVNQLGGTRIDHKAGLTVRQIHLKNIMLFISMKHLHLPPLQNHMSFNYQYKMLTKNPYGQSNFTVNPVSTINLRTVAQKAETKTYIFMDGAAY